MGTYKVLTKNHPTLQKVEKIRELMDELGISIDFDGMHTIVTDSSGDEQKHFFMIDQDTGENTPFPSIFEYKLKVPGSEE